MVVTWSNGRGKGAALQPFFTEGNLCYIVSSIAGEWRYSRMKSVFEKFQDRFGEGTAFDLDYGKLIILLLLVYLAFFKDYGI